MEHFDFTPTNGKNLRPSAARIVAAWKKAGRPNAFSVTYGETYAEFENYDFGSPRWSDSGNGCRGVDRTAVIKLLVAA